jgi:hypothetical protein
MITRPRVLRPGLLVLLMSGYPTGSVEKCNFPILHKPSRREHPRRARRYGSAPLS